MEIDIQTLVDTGKQLAGSKVHSVGNDATARDAPALLTITHATAVQVDDVTDKVLSRLPTPQRAKGTVHLLSIDSLIDFVNRHVVDPSTVIFADTDKRLLTAVINWHDPSFYSYEHAAYLGSLSQKKAVISEGDAPDGDPLKDEPEQVTLNPASASPQWADFRATYEFPFSREWKAWSAINDKPQSQVNLAHFLEDHIVDVGDPEVVPQSAGVKLMIERLKLSVGAPSRILEMARGMEVRSTENVRQVVNTTTGETQITYEQTHSNGANPTVSQESFPSAFFLSIPVFENGPRWTLLARLRYRKVENSLVWIISIQGADRALEVAFEEDCAKVADSTQVPMLRGRAPDGVRP